MNSRTHKTCLAVVLALGTMTTAAAWQTADEKKAAEKPAAAEKAPAATPDKAGEGAPADKTAGSEKLPAKPQSGISMKPMPPEDPDYVIGVEDVLAINVWREPEMSRVVIVRPDGKITLPLLGEFEADGMTPRKLEAVIAKKLETLVTNPDVSVIVQEIRSRKFNVIGEVARPGTYALTNNMTVLDAIALAGGFKDFARPKKMYVLRQQKDGSVRISVNYPKVLKGEAPQQNLKLEARDTVVVP